MLKKIIFFTSYISGLNNLFYFLNRKNQLVITYHNIIPDALYDDSLHFLVSYKESLFRKHIKYIKKKFKITTKIGIPGTCVITFDDGYRNNFLNAHKILKEENVKAIFFVPQSRELLWIDKLLMWLSYVPSGWYDIFYREIIIFEEDENTRWNALEKIWFSLFENYNTKKLLRELDNNYKFKDLEVPKELFKLRFTPLNNNEIEEMKDFGHIFGAHSVNHDILSLLNKKILMKDIKSCEKEINKLYNSKLYSYPFGEYREVSEDTINSLKNSKFEYGFMNMFYPNFEYSKYAIPRMMLIPGESKIYDIDSRLSGIRYFLRYRKLFPSVIDMIYR